MKITPSLAAKALGLHVLLVLITAALAAGAVAWDLSPGITFWIVVVSGMTFGLGILSKASRPLRRLLAALRDGVEGLRSGDQSLRLVSDRRDEIGQLVDLYNELADTLGRQRTDLRQRELLLHTALETSPAAILLVNSNGRVVLGNRAARRLFLRGRRLEGRAFEDLRSACPEPLRRTLERSSDALVHLELDGTEETFHVTRRIFHLNARHHILVMVRHLTAELRRQEAAIWRKVLRVIGHEIHNSLAPIRSLAKSGRKLQQMDARDPRIAEILDNIEDAAGGLHRFVDGYRQYARLPEPRLETVDLRSFLGHLRRSDPFQMDGDIPARTVRIDPGQIRQVLQNLLRNAREAGSPTDEIHIEVEEPVGDDGVTIRVLDRGEGMEEETLTQASLPFFSTKPGGTGLGLALSREIVEAHGGRLDVALRSGGGVVVSARLPS
ncbi:MAG: ATP-binding protein [Thermoanaerobaculia bacterium]|nr:ATP-binding protein [Thermoanaerobaculia bacterium]